MRKIHIEDKIYEYQVGKSFVKIVDPESNKHLPSISDVTGMNWADIERYCWKNHCGYPVKPNQIKTYILENLTSL